MLMVLLYLYSIFAPAVRPQSEAFTPRLLFANFILMFYTTLLTYSFLSSALGVNTPFLKNKQDYYFQVLVPVNPYVTFFSVRFYSALRDLLLATIGCFLMFGPLLLLSNTQTAGIRLALTILNVFLGVEVVFLFGNVIFFLLKRIRKGKNWETMYAEQINVVSILFMAVPGVFFYLLISNMLPAYQTLLIFSILPFINLSTGITGFFFRSGIPMYSYISILYSLVQIIILLALSIFFIKKSYSTAELGNILPILDFFDNQRQMQLNLFKDKQIPNIDKVDKNVDFYSKKTVYSLIKKEWLLVKRTNSLKNNFIFMWLFTIIVFIVDLIGLQIDSLLLILAQYALPFLIEMELSCLLIIYQSIKVNKKLLLTERKKDLYVKILLTLIFMSPFFLILVAKMNIFVFVLMLLILIIAEVLNRININSFFINYGAGGILVTIFVSVFL